MSNKLSKYFSKRIAIWLFVCFFGLLFAGCHRDLSDPFVPKDKKFNTQFKFDKKRNRTVEKHVSFAKEKGKFKDSFGGSKGRDRKAGGSTDSYSFKSKKSHGGNRFSKSKNRVVSYRKGSKGGKSGVESFGGKQNSGGGMFRFDKKSKRIVSKGKLALFGSKKHNSDMGSYAGKKRNSGGMYAFNKKKHRVTKTKAVFSGFKRFRAGDSFGGKRQSRGGEFSFNAKKKRVSKRTMLFKPRDTDPGSFSSKGGKRNSGYKQNIFSNKNKRIHHRTGIFWDLFGGRNKVSKKKKEMQLDLFDPKAKNQMRLGR